MLKTPAGLDAKQRKAFRDLCGVVERVGIDPQSRAQLIAELVQIDGRLDQLRAREAAAETERARLAIGRQLGELQAEKRRLHEGIFRGSARRVFVPEPAELEPKAEVPTPQQDPLLPDDRARAWWARKTAIALLPESERQAAYEAAVAELGKEGFLTLLEHDEEAALASARIIRRATHHGNRRDDD